MQTIERTITVPTPLAQVWDYLFDFTNNEGRDLAGAPTSQETT